MWTPASSNPVPPSPAAQRQAQEALLRILSGRRFAVLTGAGCSTESGIPDYRGPTGVRRQRAPIQYRDFLRSEAMRRRYWARSAIGWPLIAGAQPNQGHRALAALERAGRLTGLITQNVDGLHRAAGADRHVELHGSLHWVRCLQCGARTRRDAMQEELLRKNPALVGGLATAAPDGDAELAEDLLQGVAVPPCAACGGVLKPDVVFFGENVARDVVAAAWDQLRGAAALLIVGSSLTVFSGFRFARGAAEQGIPVAIVNQGPTRADELAALCVDAPAGDTLALLAASSA